MNIRRGLEKALYWIFNMSQIPPQLSTKGSVQPVVDYHKSMETPETVVIPSTAGNVDFDLSPGPGKKLQLMYGRLNLVSDVTVVNRRFILNIYDRNDVCMVKKPTNQVLQAASENKYTNIDRGGSNTDCTNIQDNGVLVFLETVWEDDYLAIECFSGQAGDAYTGILKVLEEDVKREY